MPLNRHAMEDIRLRLIQVRGTPVESLLDEMANITSSPELIAAFGDNVTLIDDKTYVSVTDLINHLASPVGYCIHYEADQPEADEACMTPEAR